MSGQRQDSRSRREQVGMGSRLPLTVAPLALAFMLAACGGTTTKTVTTTAQASATSSPTTPASATTSATSTTTTTTSAVSRPPLCTAPMLKGSLIQQQGAAGHGLIGFALRNTSGHGCHTYGYPGVAFLSASGAVIPGIPIRARIDAVGAARPIALTVGPGGTVSFRMVTSHVASSPSLCHTATTLQVIPPDDTQTLRIVIPGGAYTCARATVSALQPGTSAYPH